jgi:VanZ family protein
LVVRRRRRATLWAAAVYLSVVAAIVFWPNTTDLNYPALKLLRHLTHAPMRVLEFGTNVLLFVPFGMLGAAYLSRRRWWLAMIAGAALSTAIEIIQGTLLPGRYPSLSDIAANTTGAVLGVLVMTIVRLIWRWGRPRPAPPRTRHRPPAQPSPAHPARRRSVDGSEDITEPMRRAPAYGPHGPRRGSMTRR